MSKKRKAENDQHATLLDFFNTGGNAKSSSVKGSQVSKKQRTISGSFINDRNASSGKGMKITVKQKQKNVVPEGAEIIELLDSDEEVLEDMMPIESFPQTPERPPFKHMETGPQEIVDLAGDGANMTSPGPPFIDCSAFFLDSPERAGDRDNNDVHVPEEEFEREVSARWERMSPEEWGLGDDEGFSEGAGTGTGASEPEDEMYGTELQGQRDQVATFGMGEEIEEEPLSVQLIELSDDDEADIRPVHSKERVCPICQRDFLDTSYSVCTVTDLIIFTKSNFSDEGFPFTRQQMYGTTPCRYSIERRSQERPNSYPTFISPGTAASRCGPGRPRKQRRKNQALLKRFCLFNVSEQGE